MFSGVTWISLTRFWEPIDIPFCIIKDKYELLHSLWFPKFAIHELESKLDSWMNLFLQQYPVKSNTWYILRSLVITYSKYGHNISLDQYIWSLLYHICYNTWCVKDFFAVCILFIVSIIYRKINNCKTFIVPTQMEFQCPVNS